MKSKQEQGQRVGTLSLIMGALFALLATFNLINNIFSNIILWKIVYLSIPFYAASIICVVYKNKVPLSYIFLAVAIYSCVYNDNINDYSGAIFFCFSIHVMNNRKYSIIVAILALMCLSINSAFFGFKFNTALNLVIAYSSIYVIYYFLVTKPRQVLESRVLDLKKEMKHQQMCITRNIDTINITEEDKAILTLYCNGYDYDKISRTLGLNVIPSTVRRKITAIKKKNKLNSDAHFAHWLFEKV